MTSIGTVVSNYALTQIQQHLVNKPRAGAGWIQRLFLLGLDFVIISLSALAAVSGRASFAVFEDAPDVERLVRPLALAIVIVWMLALTAFGANDTSYLGTGTDEYKRVASATFATGALLAVSVYLFQYPLSRGFFVLLFVIGLPALFAGRFLLRRSIHLARRHGGLMTPVLVAGAPSNVDEIAAVLRRESWLGYEVVGALSPSPARETPAGLPVLGTIAATNRMLDETEATAVIFTEGSFPSSSDFRRMAWELEERKISMIVVPALTDVSAERLEVRPVAGLPLVHVDRPRAMEASRWIKRTFDIVFATIFLVFSLPILLVAGLAIRLEDGGPILFKQVRAGRRGEPFDCYKLRSMVVDAESRLAHLAQHNEGNGVLFKMARDPRITRVGAFIRRYSIDEVPQFLNVLKGDMSVVGPRPALPREVALYDDDVMRRLHVRPGVTGLWQVSGRSDLSWEDTVRLDLYYVDNWSLLQDLAIIARTSGAILGSRGAY